MRWPDIFYKARNRPAEPELPPPFTPPPDAPEVASPTVETKPASTRPEPPPPGSPSPLKKEAAQPGPLPGAGGIALRPSLRSLKVQASPAPAPSTDDKVAQDMAEADTLRALTRSGGVRLSKRTILESGKMTGPILTKTEPLAATHVPAPASLTTPPSPQPEATPVAPPQTAPAPESVAAPADEPAPDTSSAATAPTDKPADTPLKSFSSIFRRKARMTDVARIVLPPKSDGHDLPHASPPAVSAAVIPPSFPIAAEAGRIIEAEKAADSTPATPDKKLPEAEKKPAEPIAPVETVQQAAPALPIEPVISEPEKKIELPTEEKAVVAETPPSPVAEEKTAPPSPEISKVEIPATKPEASAPSQPSPSLSIPTGSKDKREFLLANGERILGTILSETPEALYINHDTLGVLTIQRSQIAKRPIEIILINGDRIVGDIMAETDDTLYVRHASLGMLTVPRAQRSTRVVEALLTDGDRILGEVLAESEHFTVIRSATLGTVTVPHHKVSMLNRKIEQIQLKSLPPAVPELKDKAE